jgi:hypothetical protein
MERSVVSFTGEDSGARTSQLSECKGRLSSLLFCGGCAALMLVVGALD